MNKKYKIITTAGHKWKWTVKSCYYKEDNKENNKQDDTINNEGTIK